MAANSNKANKDYEDNVYLSDWVANNEDFVKTWYLSLVDELISRSDDSSQTPLMCAPVAIMKLPPSMMSALLPTTVISGLPLSSLFFYVRS